MKLARVATRAVIGGLFVGHGTQKLFGWFGGPGLEEAASGFDRMGLRPGRRNALAASVAETAGGAALALGLAMPLAGAALIGTMVTAIRTVHFKNGPWNGNGGYEFNLVLWAVAVAIAATGPGRFSLDGALDWVDNLTGLWWGVGVLVASLVAGIAVLALREAQLPAEDTDEALSREREDSYTIVS